jgi:hypothetical protein
MKFWLLAFMVFGIGAYLGAQRDPAHPFPNHEEPETSYKCRPALNAAEMASDEHACGCLGMVLEPLCGETPEETQERRHSAKCKSYCWETGHCTCDVECRDSRHQPTDGGVLARLRARFRAAAVNLARVRLRGGALPYGRPPDLSSR